MRLQKLRKIAAERDGFLPLQFINQANPEVHERTTGAEILADFGADGLDAFVAGVGTGGTISGVSHALKSANSNIQVLQLRQTSQQSYQVKNRDLTKFKVSLQDSSQKHLYRSL